MYAVKTASFVSGLTLTLVMLPRCKYVYFCVFSSIYYTKSQCGIYTSSLSKCIYVSGPNFKCSCIFRETMKNLWRKFCLLEIFTGLLKLLNYWAAFSTWSFECPVLSSIYLLGTVQCTFWSFLPLSSGNGCLSFLRLPYQMPQTEWTRTTQMYWVEA